MHFHPLKNQSIPLVFFVQFANKISVMLVLNKVCMSYLFIKFQLYLITIENIKNS
jgi:hypothetical protein